MPKVLTVIILPMETKGHCQQPGPTGVPSLRYRKRKNFTQVNSLQTREMKPPEETESVLPKGKETHLYKVPAPSLIDPFLHKWGIQICSFIGPKSTILIGQLCAFWLVVMDLLWLVSIDASESIATWFWLDSEGLSPLVKIRCQKLFYKGGS